jgi:hypothetical protein
MKLSREQLKGLVKEEIFKMTEIAGDEMGAQEGDMQQEYVNFIVAVQEAARESLEEIERGTEPYQAATDSRFNDLVAKFRDEEFYHHFFG